MPQKTAVDKKRVLIVGAGAAGMSCAHHLTSSDNHSFKVTLVDAVEYCGGQAFSIPLDESKHGAPWLNQGVQGGSHVFRHTLHIMDSLGHPASPVNLQVSFGREQSFWTNMFPTQLLAKHEKEIKRFHKALKVMRWLEPLFSLMPVWLAMKIWRFSDEFVYLLVLPSIALFLGTGNATPSVPAIIMERLFTSETFGMWYPPDKISFISNQPPMVVFPELSAFYKTWAEKLSGRGVSIRTSTEVLEIIERSKKHGVTARIKNPNGEITIEQFDELVLCTLADTAKRILGRTISWREKMVLGSAEFSDDVTVTHCDEEYMRKHYTPLFDSNQAVDAVGNSDQRSRIEAAKKEFRPMYYVLPYSDDPSKIELSFDCTHYQAQLSPHASELPLENHVYQSIFLNKARDSHLWPKEEIEKKKIIREDWWHQLRHSWKHYVKVVPWMWALNGRKRTTYAGSWTLLNAHEVAIISGMAAAWRLGGEYPKEMLDDRIACNAFRGYVALSHGKLWGKGKW